MANNRFNMQVTPKGYKAGGKVSPTKKAGPKAARSPSKQQRKMGAGAGAMAKKKNKDLTSNITGKKLTNKTAIDKINKTKAKYSALKESANSNNPMRTDRVFRTGSVNYRRPEDAIEFYGNKGRREGLAEKAMNRRIEVLKNNMATGGRIKKMGGGMMQRPMYKDGSPKKEKGAEIGGEAGFKFMNEKKGLKPVKPNQKGLKKLPTEVRNKMGFMKKGGVVSETKKKQFKANQAGQKATNKKAMKVAKGVLNVVVPAVGASEIGKKIARKFKGDK